MNTKISFKDKWHKNPDLAFSQTLDPKSEIHQWIMQRNGWFNVQGMRECLKNRSRVLDAGCGNGRVTALFRENSEVDSTEIIGIDLVAAKVAEANLEGARNTQFYQKDLLDDLTDLGQFDYIYSQEVLHHTADPQQAFRNLVEILAKNGDISIYVYKVKSPIREYTDDYLRNIISEMNYEDAMLTSTNIAKLGKVLSDLDLEIEVPAIPELGIESGKQNLQRFIYNHFFKCFWNNDLSVEDNAVVNYDWYHPQLASRHTLEEIEGWFRTEELEITRAYEDPYGITVSGRRT
ncbi:hypothetical protein MTBPR1_20074 [Candidatus Terasakiella magnetica]|uniref:Methyltransferase domain-containing protein n=1 Tax=Candidatus Terasakiella magnetica TaxID=1867952 RepID=A0A1C3RG01_9PROT|nr:class I SAM-dependent methyltransferase [Candidatus Terasakiella magnetica]SCA56226.1 hypothetical protein MTBPR1_20074 [Candidatus Terasakiella magnetica]